jgi:hypothetical protein
VKKDIRNPGSIWVLPYMSTREQDSKSPAPGAENNNHNRKSSRKRRKMIEHQIDTIMERSLTLPPNHPAQRGIERLGGHRKTGHLWSVQNRPLCVIQA